MFSICNSWYVYCKCVSIVWYICVVYSISMYVYLYHHQPCGGAPGGGSSLLAHCGRTSPNLVRLCVRVLQAPPPHVAMCTVSVCQVCIVKSFHTSLSLHIEL